jgi:2-polyprenyl-6-methoxyphenol hydroxylase-like FAD-dependent oxidoreductase
VRHAGSRATDLHARSLELWERTGVCAAILAQALPISTVPLLSGGREVARLDFGGIDSDVPAAVSLRQRELEELLEAHLASLGVSVERGVTVDRVEQDEDTVIASVDGERVGRASWLVACDGVHSSLRDSLRITFAGGDYPGRWAVMDADVEGWPYGDDEIPVFLDADGFWAMRLPDGRLRMFFRDDDAPERPTATEAQAVIDRHVPGKPRVVDALNPACFRLQHRVAQRYRSGRVLLAGDAAHAMTPVNGQGLNTGVQDAFNLAWKLRLLLAGAPDSLADSYEAERRPVALAAVRETRAVHEGNLLEGAAGEQRDRALAAAVATPAEVLAAVEAGHQLHIGYTHSPIVGQVGGEHTHGPGPRPGDRVPDAAPLVRADGTTTSLGELMRTPALLAITCVGTAPPHDAAEMLAALERRYGDRVRSCVVIVGEHPADAAVEVLADPRLRVHGRLGAVHDIALVIRPDGYLGFHCEPLDLGSLSAHLTRITGVGG